MANLDRLRELTLDAIQPALGGSVGAFRRTMAQAINRAHTAAYIAGTAERLKVSPKAVRGLSRAERRELQKAVDGQMKYLDGFVADLRAGRLTPAQASARAALYAGPARGTYSQARWGDWVLPFVPTVGSECMANCRCSIAVDDQGDGTGHMIWSMSTAEHCPTCLSRSANNPHIVRRQGAT